jgi:hypothetical protein
MAPKTSMAAASRVAGICFGKAFVRMASAPGPPEYPRLRWATRRRFDPSSSPSASLPYFRVFRRQISRKKPSKMGLFEHDVVPKITYLRQSRPGDGIFLQSFVLSPFSTV